MTFLRGSSLLLEVGQRFREIKQYDFYHLPSDTPGFLSSQSHQTCKLDLLKLSHKDQNHSFNSINIWISNYYWHTGYLLVGSDNINVERMVVEDTGSMNTLLIWERLHIVWHITPNILTKIIPFMVICCVAPLVTNCFFHHPNRGFLVSFTHATSNSFLEKVTKWQIRYIICNDSMLWLWLIW